MNNFKSHPLTNFRKFSKERENRLELERIVLTDTSKYQNRNGAKSHVRKPKYYTFDEYPNFDKFARSEPHKLIHLAQIRAITNENLRPKFSKISRRFIIKFPTTETFLTTRAAQEAFTGLFTAREIGTIANFDCGNKHGLEVRVFIHLLRFGMKLQ